MDLPLFNSSNNNQEFIFSILQEMRELFHKTGRFDDSNAKLDEILKLFATYLAYRRSLINDFPNGNKKFDKNSLEQLNNCFKKTANLHIYMNQDGFSIFGKNPNLIFHQGDEDLATLLVRLVRSAVDTALNNDNCHPFDILSETFGHFVRDNFRSNIEDAQYMTPPEVVNFMVNIAIHDIENEMNIDEEIIVADPTCGVGSFLATFYHKRNSNDKLSKHPLFLIGQDKVDRMIRITKINLELFETANTSVFIGNSLDKSSPISNYNGKVDLILTNPPFGAIFSSKEINNLGKDNFPFFSTVNNSNKSYSSELLFIDRNLRLLKDNGKMLIIVPDKVISSRGNDSLLRQFLRQNITIKALIDLPSVTFAQAGTRTRTAILYLEKTPPPKKDKFSVFIALCRDLGFEVKKRKGVPIKGIIGNNDLVEIENSYKISNKNNKSLYQVVSKTPSAILTPYSNFIKNSWTPSHYSAERIRTLETLRDSDEFNVVKLSTIVDFPNQIRKKEKYNNNYIFIGVPHIIGEGLIDYQGILEYRPVTPGNLVKSGEIILSKINPRIPRALVVPVLSKPTLCSSEFEVLRPKGGINPYEILFLLFTKVVQNQITNLTSGTSASHSRVKTEDLENLRIPLPKPNTKEEQQFKMKIQEYQNYIENLISNIISINSLRNDKFL